MAIKSESLNRYSSFLVCVGSAYSCQVMSLEEESQILDWRRAWKLSLPLRPQRYGITRLSTLQSSQVTHHTTQVSESPGKVGGSILYQPVADQNGLMAPPLCRGLII